MSRGPLRRSVAGVITLAILILVIVGFRPAHQAGTQEQAAPAARKPRPEGKAIKMPANLAGLEIRLGLKDKEGAPWNGEITVSEGRIVGLNLSGGGPKAAVEGNKFTCRTVLQQMQQGILRPRLHVSLDAPPTAVVTLTTPKGKATFKLADVSGGQEKTFLNDQIGVMHQDGAIRLTGKETEDDYPALARAPDGTAWMVYLEYQPGPPYVPERVQGGDFDSLVPTGNGDTVLLVRFDGKEWSPALEVSESGISAWRPTVTVDGKGNVLVAWSQQVDGNWEIFHRRYTPPSQTNPRGEWSKITRLTNSPGSDFHVVTTTDSTGVVWLAWQSWRKDNFEIVLTALAEGHPFSTPRVISTSKANDWSPAIAADSKGNVYVVYDTYDKGNYDVMLVVAGKESRTIPIATSARFEARPHLVCDAMDRVWITYEEGDEQWGKDYANATPSKIPIKNLGFPLYLRRTVKVKCLADGKLQQPAGDLEQVFTASRLVRNKSCPRLTVDETGGVWLFLRHHPLPGSAGEVWDSYVFRYDGKQWSPARHLMESANLMDNRPGAIPFGKGILTVYSGDNRIRTMNRQQSDLFATLMFPAGSMMGMDLAADAPPGEATVPPVHPNEAADVARIRAARIEAGGKKLHIVRGEFHRHTEYTAHNDQDGMLEDVWRYGLDASSMDWIGCGDHDNGYGHEFCWWQTQKMTDLYQNPPTFVAALTYERSVVYPNGHRNVIMPKRGIRPLPRGDTKSGTREKGTPDTKLLYAYLKHFGGICSSHTSGTSMGTDWRDNDPTVEPVVEIYQGHRHNYERLDAPRAATKETQIGGFEPDGYLNHAWDRSYKLGFQSSSDHISTHMSYGMVLVEEVSRQGIIDAFKKRHSYAATDNILVEVRSGDHIMGDVFTTAKKPTLDIKVTGTSPVAKVHVIRDNKYVYSAEPKQKEINLSFTDMDAPQGKECNYYVRIEQADGNLAWASPMWITYRP